MTYFARERRRTGAATFLLLLNIGLASPALAADPPSEVESLRSEVEQLRRRDEENRARMAEMENLLRRVLANQEAATAAPPSPAAASTTTVAAPPAAPKVAVPASSADALDAALATQAPAAPKATAPASSAVALDEALAAQAPAVARSGDGRNDLWSRPIGGGAAVARLIDISLITLGAAGGSTATDSEIGDLQGGAHDPNQNGFTLQQAELSLSGAVDPYFTGEAHIVATPGYVELEEAFLATTGLPFGLQVEAGYSLTEFGLINPLHAHAWHWLDQPVAISRMFGGEGLRSPGVRVSWLMPTPFFSQLHVGVQNADEGSFTTSFIGGEGVGGRPNVDRGIDSAGELLWLGRWNTSWDLSLNSAVLAGASVLYGPNGTGNDGRTVIYGAEAKYRWRSASHFRGWPFFIWQAEVMRRDYTADWFLAGTESGGGGGGGHDGHDHGGGGGEEEEEESFPNDLPADTLRDTAFYTQMVYGFRWGWAVGLRAEYATGEGASVAEGLLAPRGEDPLRADRLRISPLLLWHPTEFSRLRLQYNYDNTDTLVGGDAHTLWLGAEILYGEHGAHTY